MPLGKGFRCEAYPATASVASSVKWECEQHPPRLADTAPNCSYPEPLRALGPSDTARKINGRHEDVLV